MKIAIPLDKDLMLYSDNPYTAPKFAIYLIQGDKTNVRYSLDAIVDNPRYMFDNLEDKQKKCACDEEQKNDFQHICDHYSVLETISECKYLLAAKYCKNTSQTLKKGGISVFKIPAIIKKTETAIKNFLIGASFASKIQNIHNAS